MPLLFHCKIRGGIDIENSNIYIYSVLEPHVQHIIFMCQISSRSHRGLYRNIEMQPAELALCMRRPMWLARTVGQPATVQLLCQRHGFLEVFLQLAIEKTISYYITYVLIYVGLSLKVSRRLFETFFCRKQLIGYMKLCPGHHRCHTSSFPLVLPVNCGEPRFPNFFSLPRSHIFSPCGGSPTAKGGRRLL